jgi:hypothetical protein
LDSLGNKGLAAYLIAGHLGLGVQVEVTDARKPPATAERDESLPAR